MAEDKTRKLALDLGSLATGGTQEELNDEQLNEVDGGGIDQALFINDAAISL